MPQNPPLKDIIKDVGKIIDDGDKLKPNVKVKTEFPVGISGIDLDKVGISGAQANAPEGVDEMTFSFEFINADKPSTKQQSERTFSYSHDSGLIFAAFLQQYGIRDISSLHRYEFKALLSGLTEDCLFSKIVGYRTIRIDGKMSKESKAFYRKMKRLYALPPENGRKINDAEICAVFDKI